MTIDTYTSGSGNWTATVDGTLEIELWGGGGGSGCGDGGGGGDGGAGGGYCKKTLTVTATQVIAYSVGAGGAGVAYGVGGVAATGGATTAAGGTYTANGGSGGDSEDAGGTASGGTASGGDINTTGSNGGPNAGNTGGAGGASPNGGASRAGSSSTTPGVTGNAPGGGAGGAGKNDSGATGGSGQARFTLTAAGAGTDVHIIAGAEPPATIANVSAGSVAWTNVANAGIADAANATATLTAINTQTDILKCTNFGFNIPTDATILGIEVYMLRSTDVAGTVLDYKVQLYKNGTLNGSNKATGTDWTSSSTWATYGADNDLWSTGITASEINQSNFGVGIQAQVGVDTVPCAAQVDAVGITVYYEIDGLYGSDPSVSYIEALRPLAALNTDWTVSDVTNIQDAVFAPQTVDGAKNYVEGASEWNQQYSLDAPTITGTISRAALWMLISVEASETTQLVGGRVRLNGTWYDHAKVYNTISGSSQYWWCLQFNGLSEAAIGSSPAFEIINEGTATGTFYLDAAYLEIELAEGPRGSGAVIGDDLFYGVGGRTFEGYGSLSGTGELSGTGTQPAGGYGWVLGEDAFSGVGRVPDSGYGPVTGDGYFYGVGRLPDSGYGSVSGTGVLSGTGSVPASSAVVRLRRACIMAEW